MNLPSFQDVVDLFTNQKYAKANLTRAAIPLESKSPKYKYINVNMFCYEDIQIYEYMLIYKFRNT